MRPNLYFVISLFILLSCKKENRSTSQPNTPNQPDKVNEQFTVNLTIDV